MPADRIGPVCETRLRRAQQQCGRIDGAGCEHDDLRANHGPRTGVGDLDAGDALAVRLGDQPLDPRADAQFDIVVGERTSDPAGLRIHLAVSGVGERIPRRLGAQQPFVDVDAKRQRKRVEAGAFEALTRRRDRRLVRDRAERIRRRMVRLSVVEAQGATHVVKLLGTRVPGLQFIIGQGPTRRRAVPMRDRGEVLGAIADEHRPVELGVATDEIIVAGIEGLSCSIEPQFLGTEHAALEDRVRVARGVAVEQAFATLQDQNPRARRRKPRGKGRATHSRSDDEDVDCFRVWHAQLVALEPIPFRSNRNGSSNFSFWRVFLTRTATHFAGKRSQSVGQIRHVVDGSNSIALSRLKAKVWFCPGRTSASARIRAVNSLPAAWMTTKVSEPAGSTISTVASNLTTNLALRSMLSLSFTASGRIPKMTLAPSVSLVASTLAGMGSTMGCASVRSITTRCVPSASVTVASR